MRIHIIGGPGSGKTTLAKVLAAQFSIPHFDLDQVLWKHGDRLEAYIEEAFSVAAQPNWISEGIFLVWTDPLLYRADVIVLMEVNWNVAAWRIIRRHVILTARRANPYPTRLLYPFLKDTRRYYLSKSSPGIIAQALSDQAQDAGPPQPGRTLQRFQNANANLPLAADLTRRYLEKYQEKVVIIRAKTDWESLIVRLKQGFIL